MPENSHSALTAIPPRRAETMGISVIVILATGACGYWLLHTASIQFSQTIRNTRSKTVSTKSVDTLSERIRAIARDTAVLETLDQWRREAEIAQRQYNLPALMAIRQRMSGLMLQLADVYDVRIESDPNRQSGFVRDFEDERGRQQAFYLIVSAKDAQGSPVRRKVLNAKTGQSANVEQWAEQVSKEVYDRITADKDSDGTLNETLFAVKQRGVRNEDIRIAGPDGEPLMRTGQLTDW